MSRAAGKTFTAWTCALALLATGALPAWAAPTVSTTTALTSSANPVVVGSPSTLIATVTGSNPTGTVSFKSGSTVLGTATLSGTGDSQTASYEATFTTAGAKNLTAVYNGDALNIKSTSAILAQTVSKASSASSVTSSVEPSAAGQAVTFTATVTGYSPTGNVAFKDGTSTKGTVALTGEGDTRTAVFTTSTLAAGSRSITAVYAGNTSNSVATSAPIIQTVSKASATNTLASSANPSAAGAAVTFTATVTGNNPSGNVTFKDGTTTKGTVALTGEGDSKTASFTISTLVAGTRSITAVYVGDILNNAVTSAPVIQVVDKAGTSATLASSVNPSAAGQAVTFTATVTGNNPTGNVSFKDGTATKGTVALTGEGDSKTASFTTSTLAAGSRSITAVYVGNALNNAVTSAPVIQVVDKVAATATLASSVNPTAAGQAVSFTATVTGLNPTGNVAFKDGTSTKGTVALSGTGDTRTAVFTTSTLAAGARSITAVYAGNAQNSTATSDPVIQTVGAKTVAVTTLASSLNPAAAGAAVTFTASVVGTAPSGTVTFKEGTLTLGTATLSGEGDTRTAAFTTSALAAGSHSIKATYAGDAANTSDASPVLVQTISAAPSLLVTSSSLSVNPNPASLGQAVTLTATVAASGGAGPTGTVTFKDGATTLGSGALSAGVATFATSSLGAGSHALSAAYAGDTGHQASTSAPVVFAIAAGPMVWQYGYDAMGRPTTVLDPNGLTTHTYYDSLGRPIQTQQPANTGSATPTITGFAYNARDDLTKVTDPRALETTYTPNGLGQVTTQTSPDTGASQYTYDANGNVLSKTDARGKVTQYTYDNLNRPTSISYPVGSPNVLEYDGGASPSPAATGELTKITDSSGQQSYGYDSLGRMTSKTQTTNGRTFTVGYSWGDSGSALDKLTGITYPSGSKVNYSYDAQGEVASITVNPVNANGAGTSATALPLLNAITRNAESKLTGWAWASGKAQAIAYDSQGQIVAYNLGDQTGTGPAAGVRRTVLRDSAGRITAYTHTNNGVSVPALDQAFSYDNLNRLVSATLGATTVQYSYDATGNRTTKVVSGTSFANTIAPTSNWLTQMQDVLGTANIQHDAAGNITSDGTNSYSYSDRGRLASTANAGGSAAYAYNAQELRVSKSGPTALVPTGAAYFVYDEAGKLLGEYDANGTPIYETIYLGVPVGVMKQAGTAGGGNLTTSLYNVSTDQIGAPRIITRNSDEAIVWRWDSAEAFGATAPDQNPSSLGAFTFNQRFPGQVFDAESGLFQNWHRDYNPRIGGYMQFDPTGLDDGPNGYLYVGGNPLSVIDPTGLKGIASAPVKPPSSSKQSCSCKNPSAGAYAQAGVGASIQAFIGGVSGSVGAAVSTSGQVCMVRTVCGRVGPGFYVGAGGVVGGGVVLGNTDSLSGLSVGIGGDLGAGPSVGGQASVGVNPGPSVSAVGAVKGKGGGGFGMGVGLDICYSWVDCTSCD